MATNNAINAPLPLSATQGGLGVASPTAHGILVAEGSSAVTPITLTDGQLLIGSTGADPVAASLTAGTNITITPGAGTITIDSTGTWVDQTTTSVTMAANTNYVADNAALVTFTLPSSAVLGDTYKIIGKGAGLWKVAQQAGQTIHFIDVSTTSGTGGSLAATKQFDTVTIVCITANTDFSVDYASGNLTVV